MEENDNIIGDKFWYMDPKIILDKNRITYFFPTYDMTTVEKLNSIVRLSIYIGIILYAITNEYKYLFIIIIILLFTLFIFKNQKDNIELYFNSYDSRVNKVNRLNLEKKKCTEPTYNNPFMNINKITDDRERPEACTSWDNKDIQESIENKFNFNLYRDVSDLFNRNNSQREYYTMPSTTIPNKQTEFAKWCYNTGPTCKESSINCTTEWSPVQNTTDVYKYVPRQF